MIHTFEQVEEIASSMMRGSPAQNALRHFYKCHLLIGQWTNGRATDVVLRSPACARWEKGTPQVTTLRGKEYVD